MSETYDALDFSEVMGIPKEREKPMGSMMAWMAVMMAAIAKMRLTSLESTSTLIESVEYMTR